MKLQRQQLHAITTPSNYVTTRLASAEVRDRCNSQKCSLKSTESIPYSRIINHLSSTQVRTFLVSEMVLTDDDSQSLALVATDFFSRAVLVAKSRDDDVVEDCKGFFSCAVLVAKSRMLRQPVLVDAVEDCKGSNLLN